LPSTPTAIALGWKHDLLPCHHLGHIQVEEVAVEDGLDDTGHNSDDVIEAFKVVAVDPVEDVERTVGAKSEEVVGGDGLSLSGLGHHEQLGEDRDTLEIDGEGPEDLHDTKLVVEDQGEDGDGSEKELDTECIVVAIVGSFELYEHQVDCPSCAGNEKYLHCGVVDTDKVGDKVEISGDEHDEEEDLALARDAGAGASLPYLKEQDDDRKQMRNITK